MLGTRRSRHSAEHQQASAMRIGLLALASVGWAAAACNDPFPFDASTPPPKETVEVCAAGNDWLPNTPAVDLYKPPAHPAGECPFYRASWQNFLIATQPDATGRPALQRYATVDDLFRRTVPRPEPRAWLGDVKQAGARQILIDQNGRPIYYGIHVNQAFAEFVADNHLETADAIRDAPSDLFLPGDIVELKSAWQEVDEDDPSSSTYITTRARVSRLRQVAGRILEDHTDPREVTLRLLALHVAFTLPGHPELIWSTFEHSTGSHDRSAEDGKRDVAPIHPGGSNPKLSDPNNLQDDTVVSDDDYVLFEAGTRANAANQAIAESDLKLDPETQSFPGAQTSIYRMFAASKSNTTDPDDAISSLNANVEALFAKAADELSPTDQRGHYRLVGAVWMDKPQYFKTDATLGNDETSPFAGHAGFARDIQKNGSDSELSILAGEDRLSSVAMESFTQSPAAFPNCFSCHNTQAVTEKGIPIDRDRQGTLLIEPKQINVSHVFSQFVLDEVNASL
jgi:hypothetical protein